MLPTDDQSAIERQVAAMKQMAATGSAGGRAGARLAADRLLARRGPRDHRGERLAIVLGVEVDSLGNWRRLEDLEELSRAMPTRRED